jgi:CysZ protein
MQPGPAISGGLKDVLGGKLGGLAFLCFVVALAATIAAAWAAFRYLMPLIPEGEGWWRYVWTAAEWLAGAGVVILSVVLAPAVSMVAGGALFDVAAANVEKRVGLNEGRLVPLHEGLFNGVRIAWPALVLNVISLPLIFVPVVNIVWFLALNGYLMGREYFSLAAIRRMSWAEAKALRQRHAGAIFIVGLVAAIVPFWAPLFGASAMTRLISGARSNN